MNEISNNQSKLILDAAIKCISTNGYANTSMRDIAEEANVVLSQVNYYYKNKEGLFIAVIQTLSDSYIEQIEKCLKSGNTSKDNLLNLSNYFRDILINSPKLFRLLYDFISMSLWSKTFGDLLVSLFKNVRDLIGKYVFDDNIFTNINLKNKNYSSDTLATMIFGLLLGISIQYMLDPHEEIIAEFFNVITEVI